MTGHQFRIKCVYKPPDDEDGVRVLVDRLWPRGLSRERARIATPSSLKRATYRLRFIASCTTSIGNPEVAHERSRRKND
jgi:Protein of unknown function, DUF488